MSEDTHTALPRGHRAMPAWWGGGGGLARFAGYIKRV